MKTCPAWLRLLIAGAFTAAISPSATITAGDGSSAEPVTACAVQIADITGDGVRDFSVSGLTSRANAQLVYLLAGDGLPLPAELDAAYLRAHLAGVLRGPAAVPFTCPNAGVTLERRIGGAARLRSTPLTANTLIDQPAKYRVVDLDPLTPGGLSVASRINAAGYVVGRFLTNQGFEHAFVYDGAVVRDLGTLGGHFSDAKGINRHGQIVGYSLTGATDSFGFVQAAFLSDGGPMLNLNRDWSAASAINDKGQIVGEMRVTPGVDLSHAFLYDQGTFTDLGSLPPLGESAYSTAHAINNRGQIVGQSNTYVMGVTSPERKYPSVRPFLFAEGVLRDLGSLGAWCFAIEGGERCLENSVATDINNRGLIVGFSTTASGPDQHAFVSDGEELEDLDVVENGQSWAYGVNDSGQIVGGYFDGSYRPFMVERGKVYNLNDLIVNPPNAGALPFAAYDIDNFGRIAGNHHVLEPIYERIQPGQPLAFTAALGKRFGVAFWFSRANGANCHAVSSELRLQVRFDLPGQAPGDWVNARKVRRCGDSRNWRSVSVSVPPELQGQSGVVRVRVREVGPDTDVTLYLRHFTME